jgi:hypothetical protein
MQKLWVMEKVWMHILIQRKKLRWNTINLSCAKILFPSVIINNENKPY